MREHAVTVLELDTEHGVGERFDDRPFNQDRVVLGLRQGSSPRVRARREAHPGGLRHRLNEYYELCKPRVVMLIVFTAIIGRACSSDSHVSTPVGP